MINLTSMKSILLAALLLLFNQSASAHFIWLEQTNSVTGGQTNLYFGEYDSNLKEKSGGRLDNIASPKAMLLGDEQTSLTLQRLTDSIAIEGTNNKVVIANEVGMKVKDMTKYHFGIAKPMYYARFGNNVAESMSTNALDLQPLGKNKVRANLNGKPLAKAKFKVIAPNQWLQELDADDNGEILFTMPWDGLYVMEVVYLEPKSGIYQGDAYENIRHVSTLSIVKK